MRSAGYTWQKPTVVSLTHSHSGVPCERGTTWFRVVAAGCPVTVPFALLRKGARNCPTGKSILIFGIRVKRKIRANRKYFCFPEAQISATSQPIPSRQEGRIMIAMIVGRVAVDAGSADSERHESVR